MRYDYIKFIKDKLPTLAKDSKFEELIKLLYDGDLNIFISEIINADLETDLIDSRFELNRADDNDTRNIIMYKNLNAIESYGQIKINKNQTQTVSEIIYKNNDTKRAYSYAEILQGPKGTIILGTTAKNFNSYNIPNDINMGFWCYDNNILKDKKYCKFLKYITEYNLDNKEQLNYYKNLITMQNDLNTKYILPDIYVTLEATFTGEEYKTNLITLNQNIQEQTKFCKEDITSETCNFKCILGRLKDKYIEKNINYIECANITKIEDNMLLNGYFNAIQFFEAKENTKNILEKRKKPKQYTKNR